MHRRRARKAGSTAFAAVWVRRHSCRPVMLACDVKAPAALGSMLRALEYLEGHAVSRRCSGRDEISALSLKSCPSQQSFCEPMLARRRNWPIVFSAGQVPSTMYCGGFVCKQNSMANRFRKTSGPPAPGSKDQDGESAQTYYTSVELIQKETPEKFCLENTSKAPFEETVADLRARLGQYYIKGFKLQVPLCSAMYL